MPESSNPSDSSPEIPVRTFKLTLEYDGLEYAGWQRQLGSPTVQAAVEEALGSILGARIVIAGSGRTDAGVHAEGQVASFEASTRLDPKTLVAALNGTLPRDIAVLEAEEMPEGFHARISAVSKLYRYRILNREARSALERHRAFHVRRPLCLDRMREAARDLVGTHDFRAFACKVPPDKSCVRTLNGVDILRAGEYIHVEVEANGFLQRMVRTIVGTLLEVGLSRMETSAIPRLIRSGNRGEAGPSAPAQGLFLVRVSYDQRRWAPPETSQAGSSRVGREKPNREGDPS